MTNVGRGEAVHCAKQPARCSVFPEGQFIRHTSKHTHTGMLSILFLAVVAIMMACTNYSAWSSTCGHYSRGMAHNTIDQNLSTCLCTCACLCTRVYMCTGMLFAISPRVCAFGELSCSGTRGSSEMLFMKLVSFILNVVERGGGCQGPTQLEISKHRKKACRQLWTWSVCH